MLGSHAQSSPIDPSEIAYLDPLGGGCYDYQPAEYEAPFGDGKGLRAEPLCLPDPCEGAVTRAELSRDIIGRPATQEEWDTYYARYAETCRVEAYRPDRMAGGSGTPFWEPFVESGLSTPVTAAIPPSSVPPVTTSAVGTPTSGSFTSSPPITADDRSFRSSTNVPEPGGDLTSTPPPATVAPIPVPGALGLLLGALAWLGWRRRWT